MIKLVLRIRDGASAAEFRLEADPNRTVLDLLERLRAGTAPVPAYRHSCHHGSCGTCGAVINGLESLMCLTRVSDLAAPRPRLPGGPAMEPELDDAGAIVVVLEPLARMTVVSGIAVEPGAVFSTIPVDTAYLSVVPDEGRSPLPADPAEAVVAQPPTFWRPLGRVRFEGCIECGLCMSACPVAVPFIGPAALAAVNREREKRPDRSAAMLQIAAASDGVGPCARYLACSRVCPQAVYPGKHIQLLRNVLTAVTAAGR